MKSFYLIVRRLLLTWEPFDPDACGLVTRWASVFCVAAVTAAMAILLIARDGTPSCPGWQPAQGRADLWPVILIIFAPAAAWIGYMAIFWKQFFRDIDHGEQARFDAMAPTNSVCHGCDRLVRVLLYSACDAFCQLHGLVWVPSLGLGSFFVSSRPNSG